MVEFVDRPLAVALWVLTLSAAALAISASLYICTQRVLLSGRIVHVSAGKRLWQAIVPPQLFSVACIAVVLWYEWARLQPQSPGPAGSDPPTVPACQAVFWLSHLTPSFYALPYIQRGLRMVVLFDTGLRRRYKLLTSVW